MKLQIILPVIFGIVICSYDFFARVYVDTPDVDGKDIANFTYKRKGREGSSINDFLEENFPVLVEQEKKAQAGEQAKSKKNSSKGQIIKKPVIKRPPEFIKVAGTIRKNSKAFVVLIFTQNNQQKKIYTLQVGDTFPNGKVIDITALGATIDVKGQRYSLPIFKDKNVKVEG